MNLEQYTADAICRAMGLPGFIDPARPSFLRMLLKPSFDPEVCVTLSADRDRPRLSVVAFSTMFWHQPAPVPYLPAAREEVTVPRGALEDLCRDFAAAHAAAHDPSGRMICVDGMGVEAALSGGGGVTRFAGHAFRPAVRGFVDRFVWWAWMACRTPRVRNALGACGRYVGRTYKRDIDPGAPAPVRVMVLGTFEDRAALREAVPKPAAEAGAL
jgi:hypothetical protein